MRRGFCSVRRHRNRLALRLCAQPCHGRNRRTFVNEYVAFCAIAGRVLLASAFDVHHG